VAGGVAAGVVVDGVVAGGVVAGGVAAGSELQPTNVRGALTTKRPQRKRSQDLLIGGSSFLHGTRKIAAYPAFRGGLRYPLRDAETSRFLEPFGVIPLPVETFGRAPQPRSLSYRPRARGSEVMDQLV
jgi:hypothetical protein